MSAAFVETSRLSNIIQMIGLSKQNGILRAIRTQGGAREIGQIRFTNGEPVAALLGPLVGQGALNVLMNWGECAYAFDEGTPDDGLADLAALLGEMQGGVTSGSWPSYHYPSSPFPGGMPSSPSNASGSLPSLDSPALSYPTPGSFPTIAPGQSMPSGPWSTSQPPFMPPPGPAYGGPAHGGAPYGGATYGGAVPRMPTSMPSAPATTLPAIAGGAIPGEILAAVPRRTTISEEIEQLPLDRHERMVLLLVDGRRTIADLMRLTRRSEWEVYNVLRHIEQLGLVQVPR